MNFATTFAFGSASILTSVSALSLQLLNLLPHIPQLKVDGILPVNQKNTEKNQNQQNQRHHNTLIYILVHFALQLTFFNLKITAGKPDKSKLPLPPDRVNSESTTNTADRENIYPTMNYTE